MDWRADGMCLDADPELFFPVGRGGPAAAQAREAKKVCDGCAVRETCLLWALETGQDAGVWGGLDEDERRALRRARLRPRSEPVAVG